MIGEFCPKVFPLRGYSERSGCRLGLDFGAERQARTGTQTGMSGFLAETGGTLTVHASLGLPPVFSIT
jgi:hypothetical protein